MRRLVVRACAAPMRAMSGMASPGSMLKHGGSGGPGVEPSSRRGRGGAMVGTRCRIEASRDLVLKWALRREVPEGPTGESATVTANTVALLRVVPVA